MVQELKPSIEGVHAVLTNRYLTSVANLSGILERIVEGAAPEKFSREHLKGIGFGGSNDRAVIPLLKDIGFLTADGSPTGRYHAYRDRSRSRRIMGEALLEAYQDLFTINENPTTSDRGAIEGKFKSTHNATDRVAQEQARTFFALLELADVRAARREPPQRPPKERKPEEESKAAEPLTKSPRTLPKPGSLRLRYNIEVHLPATKDIDVYNAIFKALREHLLVD